MSPPEAWTLRHRHAEGGAWRELPGRVTPETADDEVAVPLFGWSPGDVVALYTPGGLRRRVWVAAPDGFRCVGGRPGEEVGSAPVETAGRQDWVAFWERGTSPASRRLVEAAGVDRRRLVGAVAEAASRWTEGWPRVAALAAALDAWARGAGTFSAVLDAWMATDGMELPRGTPDAAMAALASAACMADGTPDGRAGDPATRAVASNAAAAMERIVEAVETYPVGWNGRVRRWQEEGDQLAVLRRWVPLPVLLLARVGVALPPDAAGPTAPAV